MNVSKLITTIINTAIYTSGWWIITNKSIMWSGPWIMVFILLVVVGSIAALMGAVILIMDNWNK